MTSRKLKPWELDDPTQLSQFDWLTAVGLSQAHRTSPTDLRIAQEMMRFTSGDTMLAWPTVVTLAEYIGCHRSSASNAINNLKESGALTVGMICNLTEEQRNSIGRKGRGNVYALNIVWAFETFQMRSMFRRKEPDALRKGREQKASNVADTFTIPQECNVAASATSMVAAPATSQCSAHRDAYIEIDIERNRIEAGNKEPTVHVLPENPTSSQVDKLVRAKMIQCHCLQNMEAA